MYFPLKNLESCMLRNCILDYKIIISSGKYSMGNMR